MTVRTQSTHAHNKPNNPQTELLDALSALQLNGRYSDLVITCNYRQWAVHRAIVCTRSGFFDGACANQFKEASSGVIDLSDDDEDAVDQMIHFFYHLDYLNDSEQNAPATFRHHAVSDARRKQSARVDLSAIEDPLLTQAGIYVPEAPVTPPSSSPTESHEASEYIESKSPTTSRPRRLTDSHSHAGEQGDELKSNDEDEVDDDDYDVDAPLDESQQLGSHLILHARIYALGEKYDIPSLKQLSRRKFEIAMACNYDDPEFAEAIEEVYCTTVDTDRGLRNVVLQAFRNHPRLASTTDVYAVIRKTPSLALDLFKLERGIPV